MSTSRIEQELQTITDLASRFLMEEAEQEFRSLVTSLTRDALVDHRADFEHTADAFHKNRRKRLLELLETATAAPRVPRDEQPSSSATDQRDFGAYRFKSREPFDNLLLRAAHD